MEENRYVQTKKTRTKRLVSGATGGDTSIHRGAFFAAAPWHIFQATPPAQLVVPGSGAVVGRR
jgi:hypothetical protein